MARSSGLAAILIGRYEPRRDRCDTMAGSWLWAAPVRATGSDQVHHAVAARIALSIGGMIIGDRVGDVEPTIRLSWASAQDHGTGATVTRVIFCGMTIILNGSTPLRRVPRSAASSGVIAHVGSSCSKSFSTTSGHRRHSTSSTLAPIDALVGDHHQSPCGRRPPAQRWTPCAIA